MKSDQETKDTVLTLYKTASSGMSKKALDMDSVKGWFDKLSPGAKAGIATAIGGAGVGALSHFLTPKDEDEDIRGRLLSNILAGAALGGIAGYGGHTLLRAAKSGLDTVTPTPDADKGWWQRNAPELTYSRAAIGGGLGTGALAGGALMNNIRATRGLSNLGAASGSAENTIRRMIGGSGKLTPATLKETPLMDALTAYNKARSVGLKNKLLQLVPDWSFMPGGLRAAGATARKTQADLDKALLDALQTAGRGSKATGAAVDSVLKSRMANPRRIMRAMQAPNLPKGKLALLSALLLAAGGGYQMYSAGRDK